MEKVTLFENIPVSADTQSKINEIKYKAISLVRAFDMLIPDSREKSLAITKLEESIMWANKGLSRHGEDEVTHNG